jgi:neuropilin 2
MTVTYVSYVLLLGCDLPLGMEDGRIGDSQITASSFYDYGGYKYPPQKARLNKQMGWGPGAGSAPAGQYLQIDLGIVKRIRKIATQGSTISGDKEWTTEYSVSYSNDTTSWKNYEGDCVQVRVENV